jgi:hypothetical protein
MTDEELRIFLLARKYGSRAFPPEDSERLAIVSKRVQHLLSVIDEKDVVLLEEAAASLEESARDCRSIARKYGLE